MAVTAPITYAPGWGAGQTGWAKNLTTGQGLSLTDPRYTALLKPATTAPTVPAPGAPAPAGAGGTPTTPSPGAGWVWKNGGWLPPGHPLLTSGGTTTTGTAGKPGSLVPQGLGQTYATPQQAGGPTVQTQFRDALLKQLSQDPNAITLQDPALAAQTRAFSDAQQRAIERQQQTLAEQGFAGGTLGTGAYRQDLAGLQQQRGESEAQFGAGLLGEARNQRMQELYNALQLGQGQITSDEDLALRLKALQSQTALGQSDLALRSTLGRGQLGLGLLQAMLGDRQAANRLGFDVGAFNANLNQSAMQQLLAGLR